MFMAYNNTNIAIRFTENTYATKAEVAHELKTPLIDSFWKNILKYRSEFAHNLNLSAVDRTTFLSYCLSPTISEEINNVEIKLVNLIKKYNDLSVDTNDKNIYVQTALIECLSSVAKKNNLDVDEKYLRMLIAKKIKVDDEQLNILSCYLDGLDYVKTHMGDIIDEDYLANLYSIISNDTELTQLYRDTNFDNPGNRFIIDRIYESAPVYAIVPMMNLLLKFINESQCGVTIKACAVFYYFNYVKPFFAYNEELALLLTKAVIAKSEVGDVAFTLNLERLLSDLKERVEKVCIEVQKTNDLTYMLKLFIHLFNECIEKEISRMNNLQAISLKEEYYFEAKQEAKKSPYYHENEKLDSVKEIDECDLKQEKIIKQENVNNEKESIKIQPQEEQKIELDKECSGLAISSLPPVLDEKEAARLEEHLLESDPELTRSQAYFYARHCTMGKRYTIQQFKKEVGSAYETARTSMDTLARLGYYRQEMVKNKKVYTPIKRK